MVPTQPSPHTVIAHTITSLPIHLSTSPLPHLPITPSLTATQNHHSPVYLHLLLQYPAYMAWGLLLKSSGADHCHISRLRYLQGESESIERLQVHSSHHLCHLFGTCCGHHLLCHPARLDQCACWDILYGHLACSHHDSDSCLPPQLQHTPS